METAFAETIRLSAKIHPGSTHFLRTEQTKWKKYLEHNCRSESYDAFGGSLMDVLDVACQRRLLDERAAVLKGLNRTLQTPPVRCPAFGESLPDAGLQAAETRLAETHLSETLQRVGGALDGEHVFKVRVTQTLTTSFEASQNAWYSALTPGCFARYLLLCAVDKPAPADRDAWVARCESQAAIGRARDLSVRAQSLRNGLAEQERFTEPVAERK